MHDAIPSRILNGWLRLEEDLFHLQVLSYLPPQLPSYPPQYTTHFPCGKDTAHKRPLRQLSALRLIHFNNYVPGGISCAADLTAIFRHKISVSGAPSGSGQFPPPAQPTGRFRTFAALRAGDPSAREKLIRHNLRLVAHIAKKYYALPSEQDDLISIGTIGLMKAVDTFDSTRRARFSTYASRCIENELRMHFRRERKNAPTLSLQETLDAGKEDSALTLADVLQDGFCMEDSCEKQDDAQRLRRLIEGLPARERKLILLRYGLAGQPPLTQLETAKLLQISRSYVSRLETHALELLRAGWEQP